jgi:hypothetical protein
MPVGLDLILPPGKASMPARPYQDSASLISSFFASGDSGQRELIFP